MWFSWRSKKRNFHLNVLKCYGGICNYGFCVGKSENEACNPELPVECAEKFYCSKETKLCKKILQEDEKCDDYIHKLPGHNYYILCPPGTACTQNQRCEQFDWIKNLN